MWGREGEENSNKKSREIVKKKCQGRVVKFIHILATVGLPLEAEYIP